ncbi:hypothetical protein HOI83_00690 [Candidatus Uhrbacteria bacterium]|jgi:hypothetical protein|nr:hypothetical protein [Candidatus Uhrbacteria bacterium]
MLNPELMELLRNGLLDRETKLAVIDFLVSNKDPELEADIVQLLQDWDEADQSIDEALVSRLDMAKAKFDAAESDLGDSVNSELQSLASDIVKEQSIAKIQEDMEV